MKFFTKTEVMDIASAIADANGSTLEASLKALGLNIADLETQSGLDLKKAAADEAQANDEYEKVVVAAKLKLHATMSESRILRQDADQKMVAAANKKRVIDLLKK